MSDVDESMSSPDQQHGRHPEVAAEGGPRRMAAESLVATLRGSPLRGSHLRVTPIFCCYRRISPRLTLTPSLVSTPLPLAARLDLHDIGARVLVELVEFEVAVVVARRLGDRDAVARQPHGRALDAIDDAIGLGRERAADEAFRIAPEVAVVDPRLGAELGPHHLEPLVARHARHLLVLDLDRAHGAGRTRLVPARLLPALVDQMGIEIPRLRHLVLLVPPDVAVGAGVDQVLAALGLVRIDQDDAVVALLHRAAAFGDAGRVVALVAHGGSVGDVDHRRLAGARAPSAGC